MSIFCGIRRRGTLGSTGFITSIRSNIQGSFGIIAAITIPVLLLAAGCAVDFSRLMMAKNDAQDAVDAAALAAAGSGKDTVADLTEIANVYLKSNIATISINLKIAGLVYDKPTRTVSVDAMGSIPTTFMSIANISTLPYSVFARATRSPDMSTEVVMVLDNTWSMSGGKLSALKAAALNMVNALEKGQSNQLKIGLVPYADYVNVGVENRNRSWIAVPNNYTEQRPGDCWTETTEQTCTRGQEKTCERLVDGVSESYDCTPYQCVAKPIKPYKKCNPDYSVSYSWFGCVGSRTQNSLNLSDQYPNIPYPGVLAPSKNCLNPVVGLTNNTSKIKSQIRAMVVNEGSYKPSTYIPAGLVWGVNLLSPTAPFIEGAAYDVNNDKPHKVLVLMTDGANTMALNTSNGKHFSTQDIKELRKTYADMQSICLYAQSKKIDVYTVSFMVDDDTGRNAMKSCATSPEYNFDANNAQELELAFERIAASLTSVLLIK